MTKEEKQQHENRRVISKIRDYWDISEQHYAKLFKRMRVLDMTDRGEFWKALNTKYPKYQILPDTNYVSYVKNNLVASIYSVIKSAQLIPTAPEDMELCTKLNIALEAIWDSESIGDYQLEAGDRAALLNLGITQVGWDEAVTKGTGDHILKGNIRLANIDPMKFRRDPYAKDLETSAWCCTYDYYHKSVLAENKLYGDKFKLYVKRNRDGNTAYTNVQTSPDGITRGMAKDYYTLYKWWIRNGDKISEYHVVNNEEILYSVEDTKPSCFPFAMLYSNMPNGALVGTSECQRVFANNVAYNIMDSIALTAEYKNQNPPKFVSRESSLNINAFAKHGADADNTFVVNGDASRAVHYHQFPMPSSFLPTLKMSLENGIQSTSGIDGRYTGRDTGSIITTGGTEEMLNRVTLIDNPKIRMYESYCKQLTKLVLLNMLEYSPKRKYFRKKKDSASAYETVEVDFPKLDKDTLFSYSIAISSELPKNKQRVAAAATTLLEKQLQYNQEGMGIELITPEEWLAMQDLPIKELMLERMGFQRSENALEDVAQVLTEYANLIDRGMTNDQAMQATAQTLKNKRQGIDQAMQMGGNPQLEMMASGVMPQ